MFKSGSQWYTATSADFNSFLPDTATNELLVVCTSTIVLREKNKSEIVEELSLNAK